jgi:hypothetical protein
MQSKTKAKATKQKEEDKEQSARFIATARELGVDEAGDDFEKLIKIISTKKTIKG